jgi:pyrroloquinoline quinone biosynthesis protein D
VELTSTPRLRLGVRLAYDRVRAASVLLYPEGVLVLNTTAAAVLQRCDGTSTVHEITRRLESDFDGVVGDDVLVLIDRLAARGLVEAPTTP